MDFLLFLMEKLISHAETTGTYRNIKEYLVRSPYCDLNIDPRRLFCIAQRRHVLICMILCMVHVWVCFLLGLWSNILLAPKGGAYTRNVATYLLPILLYTLFLPVLVRILRFYYYTITHNLTRKYNPRIKDFFRGYRIAFVDVLYMELAAGLGVFIAIDWNVSDGLWISAYIYWIYFLSKTLFLYLYSLRAVRLEISRDTPLMVLLKNGMQFTLNLNDAETHFSINARGDIILRQPKEMLRTIPYEFVEAVLASNKYCLRF